MAIVDYLNGLQHIGIPTADYAGTLEFYNGLGFETIYETVNDGDKVAFLELKGLVIETYESKDVAGAVGSIDHIALSCNDIEAAFAAVSAGGYELLDTAVNFLPFWDKGVRFFTFMGPNKEKIEFCQRL